MAKKSEMCVKGVNLILRVNDESQIHPITRKKTKHITRRIKKQYFCEIEHIDKKIAKRFVHRKRSIMKTTKPPLNNTMLTIRKHSSKLIGCCRDDLVQWLGFQFTPEYTWANYGTSWQMDHVIPISFFDMSSLPERNYAFHWTNIRPLNTKANLSKSSKILQHDILQHINVLKSFPGYQGHHESGCWQRVELWYGKNSEDDESFEDFLKWAIRIQNPKSPMTAQDIV